MSVAERAEASERIAERVEAVLTRRAAGVLGLYAAKGSEVATDGIDRAARAAGWRVAYPRVTTERALVFHLAERRAISRPRARVARAGGALPAVAVRSPRS